jgi:hypothetical protein
VRRVYPGRPAGSPAVVLALHPRPWPSLQVAGLVDHQHRIRVAGMSGATILEVPDQARPSVAPGARRRAGGSRSPGSAGGHQGSSETGSLPSLAHRDTVLGDTCKRSATSAGWRYRGPSGTALPLGWAATAHPFVRRTRMRCRARRGARVRPVTTAGPGASDAAGAPLLRAGRTGRSWRPTQLPAIVCLGCSACLLPKSIPELPGTDPTVVNFASCIPTVRGSCDLLGDLEQQPEATVTSAFVMLMGSPAAMEAAAAQGSHRGQPNELAFLDGAERPALTFLPHRAFRTCPAERPDERRVPYASPVAIHLPVPQS